MASASPKAAESRRKRPKAAEDGGQFGEACSSGPPEELVLSKGTQLPPLPEILRYFGFSIARDLLGKMGRAQSVHYVWEFRREPHRNLVWDRADSEKILA